MRTGAAQPCATILQCQHRRSPSSPTLVPHLGLRGLIKTCRAPPRHPVRSRSCSRIHAELPSIPGLADAGLALTEGALPASADPKQSSEDAAGNGSSGAQKGQITVKEERLANSNMRLEVTVPVDMLDRARQKALKQLRADADIPGFRKGQKIPDRIIIDDAGGKDVLVGGIVEAALNAALPLALGRFNTTAIAGSERIEEDFSALKARLDMEKPLTFHVNLDVRQPHSWKMPYKDIKVEVPSIGSPDEDPKTVELKLRQVQKEKGKMKVATGRPLQMGDIAIVNFQATRVDTNELITGSQQRGMRLDTELGDRALGIVGVVEGIMGMNVGDKRALESVVGDAWWEPEGLAGIPVRCDVTLREIFEWDVPELTDEVVKSAFNDIGTLQQLREAFSVATAAQREYDQKEKVHEALIKAVADCVEAEVPESVIRQVGENEYQAKLHELQLKEAMPYEQLDKLVNEDLLNQYIESRRAVLEEIELSSVGMNDIFEREGLTVTDDELRAEIASVTEEFGRNGQAFDQERLEEQAMEVLKAGKTLEWLENNVTVVIN